MAETDTTQAPEAPAPIFTESDSVEELWVRAYQGEILGEVLFGGIADSQSDPERARKMRVLAELERRTKEACRPALQRSGISIDADPDTLELANSLVSTTAEVPWDDILGSFGTITAQFRAMYERIGELAPTERETADLLVAHELALAEFGRKELAGDHQTSLHDIEALPHFQALA